MAAIVDENAGVVRETRRLVEDYVKAEVIEVTEPGTGVTALVVRSGNTVVPLSPSMFDLYRDEPLHRQGTAVMLSIDSLIEHVNRFKDGGSIVFADDSRERPSLTAVIDYHPGGAADEVSGRFGRHRTTFAFPLSDEWKAWTEKNAEPMSMTDFAAFVEERLPDVISPVGDDAKLSEDITKMIDALGGADIVAGPTRLMELSRGLQVNESSTVREVVNLASGEGVIQWEATHTDASGAPLRVPKVFLIGIPIFRNGWRYKLAARLRYRRSAGKIVFWYELWRIDREFDHAFKEAVEHVKASTELPVLIGKPEVA